MDVTFFVHRRVYQKKATIHTDQHLSIDIWSQTLQKTFIWYNFHVFTSQRLCTQYNLSIKMIKHYRHEENPSNVYIHYVKYGMYLKIKLRISIEKENMLLIVLEQRKNKSWFGRYDGFFFGQMFALKEKSRNEESYINTEECLLHWPWWSRSWPITLVLVNSRLYIYIL